MKQVTNVYKSLVGNIKWKRRVGGGLKKTILYDCLYCEVTKWIYLVLVGIKWLAALNKPLNFQFTLKQSICALQSE
jgi:hypothetical protein